MTTFFVELQRDGAKATYLPKATLEGGRLEASLDAVGTISLRWVPRQVSFHPPYKDCKGGRTRIEHGAFVGLLRFEGEQGFSRAVRRRVSATLTRQPHLKCASVPQEAEQHPGGVRVDGAFFTHRALSSVLVTAERTGPTGTGNFTADPGKQTGSWLGDLAVSFPGRPDVRLAGERFKGSVSKPGECSVGGDVTCVDFNRPTAAASGW